MLKISIITPSYNQSEYIERTIKSVIGQGYKNLEYIVVDGKSTDGTHEILKRYEDKIIWIKEIDKNQSDAINRGIKRSTGDIIAYLNSDDVYAPDALNFVANYFQKHRDRLIMFGDCKIIDANDRELFSWIRLYKKMLSLVSITLYFANYISQPSVFFRRELFNEVGDFDTTLEYTMDYDYWIRTKGIATIFRVNKVLSSFRVHKDSKGKTSFDKQFDEHLNVLKKNLKGWKRLFIPLSSMHGKAIVHIYSLLGK